MAVFHPHRQPVRPGLRTRSVRCPSLFRLDPFIDLRPRRFRQRGQD